MGRVLITTVYSMESVVKVITQFSIERVYLLIDKKTEDDKQQKAVKKLMDTYNKVIELKEKKVEVYDIVSVAQSVVELIDALPDKDEIYVNVTTGRKPQALGVLFAAYMRGERIKKVMYVIEETKNIIEIPKLSFDVSKSQLKILECIGEHDNLTQLSDKLKISRAMLYRNIKSLKAKGLIEDVGDGMKLTDAGRIARL